MEDKRLENSIFGLPIVQKLLDDSTILRRAPKNRNNFRKFIFRKIKITLDYFEKNFF